MIIPIFVILASCALSAHAEGDKLKVSRSLIKGSPEEILCRLPSAFRKHWNDGESALENHTTCKQGLSESIASERAEMKKACDGEGAEASACKLAVLDAFMFMSRAIFIPRGSPRHCVSYRAAFKTCLWYRLGEIRSLAQSSDASKCKGYDGIGRRALPGTEEQLAARYSIECLEESFFEALYESPLEFYKWLEDQDFFVATMNAVWSTGPRPEKSIAEKLIAGLFGGAFF